MNDFWNAYSTLKYWEYSSLHITRKDFSKEIDILDGTYILEVVPIVLYVQLSDWKLK